MIFQADLAFALELIALVLGFWILMKARSKEAGNLKGFGSFIGYFVIVSALLALLCTGYYSLKYWNDGYFDKPAQGQMMMKGAGGMMMGQMSGKHHDNMMGKMGMDKDQCAKMMKNGMDPAKCEQMKSAMMNDKMMKGNMDHDMMNKSDMGEEHSGMKDDN